MAPIRELVALDDGIIYLNSAGLTPTLRPAYEAQAQAATLIDANPVRRGYGEIVEVADAVRGKAAAFIGAAAHEVTPTTSTSDGMNLVAEGVGLTENDVVLTTNQEHPGGRACWQFHPAYRGKPGERIAMVTIRPDHTSDQIVTLFAEAAERLRPKVISVSHVCMTTGRVLPVRAIGEVAKQCDALMVIDGAQAVGAIDVDVSSLHCHVYAACGHKWLIGPMGTGFLYLSDEGRERIRPPRLALGLAAYSRTRGSQNLPALVGLGAAIDYLAPQQQEVRSVAMSLRDQAYRGLESIDGVRLLSPPPGSAEASPLVTFQLETSIDACKLVEVMYEKHRVELKALANRIELDPSEEPDYPTGIENAVRVSPHAYNTAEEVTRFLQRLAIAKEDAQVRRAPS